MDPYWVNLNVFFGNGKNFTVDDPSVWTEPIKEFNMDCEVSTPLVGELFLSPNETGCLINGKLSGAVLVPCNRCAIKTQVVIERLFKNFEPFPAIDEKDGLNALMLRRLNGVYEISLANILWEEFVLALPLNALCKDACKGLCFNCGKDLNKEDCVCAKDKVDPRFDALRTLKIPSPAASRVKT